MSKLKILILSVCLISLTGCVAAVVAGAAGLVYDRRSIPTMEADARFFHVIHTAIVSDPDFAQSKIAVTSFNRIILLVGQTNALELKTKAAKIAENTPGVLRVYNEISVSEPTSVSRATKDSWITSQIRSKLLTKKGLESGSIRVVTEDGVVYLMGIVSTQQAILATDVARRINGVLRVVKLFQYIG